MGAVRAVVATHDALRMRLTRVASVLWSLDTHPAGDEVPVRVVETTDLATAQQQARTEAAEALDPEAGPVLSAVWLTTGQTGRLVVAVHPIVADGVSVGVLAADLAAAVTDRLPFPQPPRRDSRPASTSARRTRRCSGNWRTGCRSSSRAPR
ncbi:condensation domain-containing protein [Rhodococcus pyridinivorans]|uniref:condensation domain-containing protein n=1 Tax=Rhodococcus pyridinivorans TaxID=103816 RepID=UPI0020C7C536|nr:condensation domain-containing protein [Rhodococcus pyridinivorans]